MLAITPGCYRRGQENAFSHQAENRDPDLVTWELTLDAKGMYRKGHSFHPTLGSTRAVEPLETH